MFQKSTHRTKHLHAQFHHPSTQKLFLVCTLTRRTVSFSQTDTLRLEIEHVRERVHNNAHRVQEKPRRPKNELIEIQNLFAFHKICFSHNSNPITKILIFHLLEMN